MERKFTQNGIVKSSENSIENRENMTFSSEVSCFSMLKSGELLKN